MMILTTNRKEVTPMSRTHVKLAIIATCTAAITVLGPAGVIGGGMGWG